MDSIKLENLSFSYGKDGEKILKNINHLFETEKVTAIIGPNGSGKTTLLKNIANQLSVNKNSIFVNDIDVKNISTKDFAKKIAIVNQSNYITFNYTVMDIVLMGRTPYIKRFDRESKNDIKIANDNLSKTDTLYLKNSIINQISGGELQKVILARAFTQETNILLLDEPISMLDINNQLQIMNIVKEEVEKNNKTVIIVLHDLNITAQFSDKIILMKNGSIYKYGDPKEVITEENINDVYGVRPTIINNPKTNKPFIIYYE